MSESGGEIDEVMHLERDDFIGIMLHMHQANSSRKWRLMMKRAELSTYRDILEITDRWRM